MHHKHQPLPLPPRCHFFQSGYVPPPKIKIVPKPVNGKQFSSYNEEVRGAAGGEGGRETEERKDHRQT